MRLACLFGFHGSRWRWDPRSCVWRCAGCGAIMWVGSPPGLDQGTLRVRWLTDEEARLRAEEGDCEPVEVLGFQDRGRAGDLVIRYDQPPWEKFATIIHEFLHWVASKLPRQFRRTIDYALDGEYYE